MAIRRPASVADVHDTAGSMPHVRVLGEGAKVVYQVGGKSFVFFRNPRPDAVDEAGARLDDVIVIWVASEEDKRALVLDEGIAVLHDTALRRAPLGARPCGPAGRGRVGGGA